MLMEHWKNIIIIEMWCGRGPMIRLGRRFEHAYQSLSVLRFILDSQDVFKVLIHLLSNFPQYSAASVIKVGCHKLRELPTLSHDYLLVTLHISSLYTNIPHEDAIKACEELLRLLTDQSLHIEDLFYLILLILSKNVLYF